MLSMIRFVFACSVVALFLVPQVIKCSLQKKTLDLFDCLKDDYDDGVDSANWAKSIWDLEEKSPDSAAKFKEDFDSAVNNPDPDEIYELIAHHGAERYTMGTLGWTLERTAAIGKPFRIKAILRNYDAESFSSIYVQAALAAACKANHLEVVDILLEKFGQISISDYFVGKLSRKACRKGHVDMEMRLLEHLRKMLA